MWGGFQASNPGDFWDFAGPFTVSWVTSASWVTWPRPESAQETPTIEVDQLAALGEMAKGGKALRPWVLVMGNAFWMGETCETSTRWFLRVIPSP